ncbi:transcriptional regulator [Flavobacterium cauense R2A-7]|uniref:TetR family transcriptional regulator n=1 Tax=Flavobacterium cauense R2A-7 TaxID=1341154 RepID=V6RYR5_9FLAO|nr:TetR family transcriptional regulator [Flavobacterium cauense]ESU19147.1 transcriptional regulator [Flavobacterium cauense R2A-7]KGO82225.1 transcriptional regulator [Flavobacterium cauense R2A-7]TWI15181.1 TetR family transcriptional regulator [Flavobacterium cauense R2A-7]
MTDFNDKQIEILQVAENLFAEQGFDGTSVRDIAKSANINIAMISYYFGSKEKLLEALILYRISDMRLQMENLYREELTPIEKIDRLIELYIKRIHQNKGMYQIIHFEISSGKRIINCDAFNEMKKNNLEVLKNIIKEGQDKNIFNKDVNVVLLPTTIMGTYFHFQMNKPFFKDILNLNTQEDINNYVYNELTIHIKQTIKALLTYEK